MAAAIRLVFSLTLVSRFAGLAREILVARVLQDSALGSAFAAGFQVPNLFRRLFGEGALSAAFLPEYTTLVKSDPPSAAKLASLVLAWLGVGLGLLLAVIEIILALALIFGHPSSDGELSVRLTMVMLPMMPMVCITAILGGMLQAHGRFGPPAAAPILLNIFMVGACLLRFVIPGMSQEATAYSVSVAAVAASIAQIAWSAYALRGLANWTRDRRGVEGPSRTVLSRFLPVVIGLGALQLSTMADSLIAMWPTWIGPTMFGQPVPLDKASNVILSTTSRFYQFPLGVFGIAVATAVFPLLSRAASDLSAFSAVLHRGLRISFFIGLPASAGLLLVADDLTSVMLSGGENSFSDEGVARSADVLMGFAPAVWAYSLNNVLTRAFYARGDTKTPMTVSLTAVVLNLAFNLMLIWPLREAGLAWATAASATIQFLLLCRLSSTRLATPAIDRRVLGGFARTAIATAVMTAALLGIRALFAHPEAWHDHAIRLGLCVVTGAASYAIAALLLHCVELRWLLQRGPAGGAGAAGLMME